MEHTKLHYFQKNNSVHIGNTKAEINLVDKLQFILIKEGKYLYICII